jgi:hypothetical protein
LGVCVYLIGVWEYGNNYFLKCFLFKNITNNFF